MKKFEWIGNFGLFVLAIGLLYFLSVPLFLCSILILVAKRKLSNYFWELACVVDELGNVLGGPVWNLIFFKRGIKPMLSFGSRKETMSMVFGVNITGQPLEATDLNLIGVAVCKIIDFLDKGHMARAATNYYKL